jgi:hypothetical protein
VIIKDNQQIVPKRKEMRDSETYEPTMNLVHRNEIEI